MNYSFSSDAQLSTLHSQQPPPCVCSLSVHPINRPRTLWRAGELTAVLWSQCEIVRVTKISLELYTERNSPHGGGWMRWATSTDHAPPKCLNANETRSPHATPADSEADQPWNLSASHPSSQIQHGTGCLRKLLQLRALTCSLWGCVVFDVPVGVALASCPFDEQPNLVRRDHRLWVISNLWS